MKGKMYAFIVLTGLIFGGSVSCISAEAKAPAKGVLDHERDT